MDASDDSIGPMVTPESGARELRANTTDGAAVLARRAISLLSSSALPDCRRGLLRGS